MKDRWIALAREAGIQVRMITGDHAITAEAIARKLGIEGRAITGAEFAAMSDDQLANEIDGIGVIARVTPEDKVRLVDTLKKKELIVAMTGDGVNDAPALKRADIGIAMGITGTEVSRGRGDDPDRRQFLDHREGRRARTRALRQPDQVHPLPDGRPGRHGADLPQCEHLQHRRRGFHSARCTLWLNFTTQVFQAIGLGYGKPSEGLMKRKPRASNEPLLPRSLMLWLGIAGLVMALGTLALAWWGDDEHGTAFGRTMAFTTFALFK